MNAATAKRVKATLSDPRWPSILARDQQADGSFVYSVATTGVFCRPSCPSRHARPENVRFHSSPTLAVAAGFRPCQRCRPLQPPLPQQHAACIATACRTIEQAATEPTLRGLASAANLSPAHFHRLFRSLTGVTPKQYALAHRAKIVRQNLQTPGGNSRNNRSSQTVTEAIYNAGYNSSSRFYEASHQILGMTPSAFRAGAPNEDIRFALGQTTLGAILLAQSARGLCAILLGDDPETLLHQLEIRFPRANLLAGDTAFESLIARVVGLIETPSTSLDLPLDIRGTAFQQRVWQALRQLPAGSTASYTEIANRVGLPRSIRAVAQACAANTLAVAIPCHRVVRQDGNLAGYRWGIDRKRSLLAREAALLPKVQPGDTL